MVIGLPPAPVAPAEKGLVLLRAKIQEVIGETYRCALFYRFAGSLRFELSSEGSPLEKVLTALGKATAICNDVFEGEERILVHLQAFASASRFSLRKMLRELQQAGIVIPSIREVWVDRTDDDDDGAGCWVSCAFEVPVTKLQNLLWCAVAADFSSVRPNPHCRVYLIKDRFLHSIPIVVHELEYYDQIASRTAAANPPGLAKEFVEWVNS